MVRPRLHCQILDAATRSVRAGSNQFHHRDDLMRRSFNAVVFAAVLSGLTFPLRADEQAAKAVVEKGIKALGGEEKLKSVEAVSWKSKGKLTFGENETEFTTHSTAQGLDHYRSEFNGEFNGNPVKAIAVINGDKGWRKFGEQPMELDGDALANEKRRVYLYLIPATLVPLTGKNFKLDTVADQKVGDKPAAGVKATGPDGKDFTIFFDKESGLPVKLVATVVGFDGQDYSEEQTYADYKDFDGVKKATKIEAKRDGERFMSSELIEFKVEQKVDPKTFAAPE
jgi:hypothetical protein